MAAQLMGPAAIVAWLTVWLGAGLLGGLTVDAEMLTHRFWELDRAEQLAAVEYAFFEHIGMLGALTMKAIVSNHRVKSSRSLEVEGERHV